MHSTFQLVLLLLSIQRGFLVYSFLFCYEEKKDFLLLMGQQGM